jgi:ribosomal protein S18 acetylase RimI-like enzyme
MARNVVYVTSHYGEALIKMPTDMLAFIIYQNFIHAAKFPKLKHNMNEINRILNSKDSFLVMSIVNSKLIGYILGEYIGMEKYNAGDSRRVVYITYLYVVPKHRKHNVASKMLDYLYKFHGNNASGFMLTFDTYNKKLKRFYENRGFMQDVIMRNFGRFDVYYRNGIAY